MGFATGLAAGERSGNFWDVQGGGNPYAMMPAIGQALQAGGRPKGLNPGRVHSNAAAMALAEKKLDIEKEKNEIEKAKMLQVEQDRRFKAERFAQGAPMRGIEAQHAIDKNFREGQEMGLKTEKGIREGEAHTRTMMEGQRQDDFAFAQWGLSARNPEPIISFFKKYGDPKANIESIDFGPEGTPNEQEIIVKYEGLDKTQIFNSPDDFFKGLMAFGSPQLQKYMENEVAQGRLTRTEQRKEEAHGLKMNQAKGALNQNQKANIRIKGKAAYVENFKFGGIWAGKKPGDVLENGQKVPTEKAFMAQYESDVTGQQVREQTGEGTLPAIKDKVTGKNIENRFKNKDGSETFQFTDKSTETRDVSGKTIKKTAPGSTKETGPGASKGVKSFRDPATGNIRKVYPGGKEVITDANGKVLDTKEAPKAKGKAEGLQVEEGDDEKIDKFLDEEAKKKPEKKKGAPKKAKGLPDKTAEAKKEGGPASSQSYTYTDPKTGKTVTKTLTGDVSKAGAKIETRSRKKKKKKKKSKK